MITPTILTTEIQDLPLNPKELNSINNYWSACNYLAAGMIYLRDNPLLKELTSMQFLGNPFIT